MPSTTRARALHIARANRRSHPLNIETQIFQFHQQPGCTVASTRRLEVTAPAICLF